MMRASVQVQVAACGLVLAFAGCKSKEPAKAPPPAGVEVGSPVAGEPSSASSVVASGPAVVLAEVASPDVPAGALAPPPVAGSDFMFSAQGRSVAWVALSGESYRVVLNGRAGPVYRLVGDVVMSPDGRRWAHAAMVVDGWRMVVDGVEGPRFDEVALPVFSPDGAHVVYPARLGASWRLLVDGKTVAETQTRFGEVDFCGDSSRVVFIDGPDDQQRGRLVITEVASKAQTVVGHRVSEILQSPDRSRLAAVSAEGEKQQRVLTIAIDGSSPPRLARGAIFDTVEQLAFGPGGSLAYVGTRGGARVAVLDGREVRLPAGDGLGAGHLSLLVIRPDRRGIGGLVQTDAAVSFREYLVKPGPREPSYEEAEHLVYGPDGRSHAYAARRGGTWFVVVDGKEGPPFDRVVTPSFSPDGKLVVYRARQDGKRFVVVADASGKTIRKLPSYDQVFPVLFSEDGKAIVYGVKDGQRLSRVSEPL
jgi:hypothetical protein